MNAGDDTSRGALRAPSLAPPGIEADAETGNPGQARIELPGTSVLETKSRQTMDFIGPRFLAMSDGHRDGVTFAGGCGWTGGENTWPDGRNERAVRQRVTTMTAR